MRRDSLTWTNGVRKDLVVLDDGTLDSLRLWMGTRENCEFLHLDKVLKAMAEKVAIAIPTLQFLHIRDKSWQIPA